ncbi:hypothetical protein [Fusobacterium perfoetens]|uniref:hypothetical protein n=1 Tax=Fusobacterium perfoetens TaxID=852 RepID=UPI0004869D90|nr:hypothetical protein [Fusobacterium perfoetens]
MEKLISFDKYSKVIYDSEKNVYIKIFKPKIKKRILYFFRIRRYPGYNFKYMTSLFNKLGIKTAEIIDYGKYYVITKSIEGKTLAEILDIEIDEKKIKKYIFQYEEILEKIIKGKIYYADFHFGNFIVFNEELYVLDLEDYKKEKIFIFNKEKMLKKLREKLNIIINNKLIKKGLNANFIYEQIKSKV